MGFQLLAVPIDVETPRRMTGGFGGIRGECLRERDGAFCVSKRPGFPAMGFLSRRSRIASILRRRLRSAQCAVYQGGSEYASIRQAKEQVSQARLSADLQRDSVRASVVSSYGLLETARASIISSRAAVKAAETALTGVRREAKVGSTCSMRSRRCSMRA
jgi:hypothetical protein